MIDHCPLRGQAIERLPDICHENCEALWEEATDKDQTYGEYDHYRTAEELDCLGGIETSHAALQVTGHYSRVYTIVDACIDHGNEVGEQSYSFDCPLPVGLYLADSGEE